MFFEKLENIFLKFQNFDQKIIFSATLFTDFHGMSRVEKCSNNGNNDQKSSLVNALGVKET